MGEDLSPATPTFRGDQVLPSRSPAASHCKAGGHVIYHEQNARE